MEQRYLFSLSDHSEQLGDQGRLTSHIPFGHPLHLPFPYDVHDLESLSCFPLGQIREKAHSRFRSPFDEAVILFNKIPPVLHLSQFTAFGNDSHCFQFIERFRIGSVFVDIDHAW